jgi:hypothetical protein
MKTKQTAANLKALKLGILLAIFSATLALSPIFSQFKAHGEETDAPVIADVMADDQNSGSDAEQMPSDLKEEKVAAPAISASPEITWQKNAEYLGDFMPDEIYIFENDGSAYKVIEHESIADDDGAVNLVAMTMDENDFYTFRMTYPKGQNWEQAFVQFATTFKK